MSVNGERQPKPDVPSHQAVYDKLYTAYCMHTGVHFGRGEVVTLYDLVQALLVDNKAMLAKQEATKE